MGLGKSLSRLREAASSAHECANCHGEIEEPD
jgi:cytochrome c553